MRLTLILMFALLTVIGEAAAPREPLPYKVAPKWADRAQLLSPSDVQLEGYLGRRVLNSEKNRLLEVDEEELLAGFRHRPGKQAWIGEHVGKWLHAATLAWANTGDPALRSKLDRVVRNLLATQEPDGYLGTYTPDKRFGLFPGADWDVWVHKYDLIGLLTCYRFTGNKAALEGARKVGDLLVNTFGPGRKSIISAGTHVGMAATSVLEPVVLLYRVTGDPRYLDFARYLVSAWDEPSGPHILSSLLTTGSVAKTANGKAYEMLSNLVGLSELARVTGEQRYREAITNAWKDVVEHRLYITGTASQHEHFRGDYDLPNDPSNNIGETCVTVTWIQLNAQLLRLTGEARCGDELERSYYNHLSAAQRPDGAAWCYYTALEGTKPYGNQTNCCLSSGPRGMALAPELAYLKFRTGNHDGLMVNLFETSRATAELDGRPVTIDQHTTFPREGSATLTVHTPHPATFALRVRSPAWAAPLVVRVGREEIHGPAGGWAEVPARKWHDGDQVKLAFTIAGRMVAGDHTNAGHAALMWGPMVLAYDESRNPGLPPAESLVLPPNDAPALQPSPPPGAPLAFAARISDGLQTKQATFVPFAEAGATGGRYAVWLREANAR